MKLDPHQFRLAVKLDELQRHLEGEWKEPPAVKSRGRVKAKSKGVAKPSLIDLVGRFLRG